MILGRRSYDEWKAYWGPIGDDRAFAPFINGVAKHVATSTPIDDPWTNTAVIEGDLVEFVRGLKDQPGGDIGVHASISVTQTLLASDVVDEVKLVIAPKIAGPGRRLFDGGPTITLEAIRSSMSPSGSLMVNYRVIRP